MGLVDNVERGLEKLVTSVFRGAGNSEVKPVEIASRLRNHMDAKSLPVSRGRTLAPNRFEIRLSESDFARAREWGSPLAEELCSIAVQHAKSQGYSLQGAVRVNFHKDSGLKQGIFEIDSSSASASSGSAKSAAPAAAPAPPQPSLPPRQPSRMQPVLDIDGQRFALNAGSIVLGRSAEADIPVDDSGVSRKHLEIQQRGKATFAVDLGSTNGSYVNGQRVSGETELLDGSVITMGRTRITFRLLPQPQGGRV
ncbi:FhaA domain-containing protein [Paeniglutamicibacter cryotolerans]|uniref:FHA domain-containing protein n=1 Tax=Paeniglutamicibacter cryotolerans TaxID=670079 RepID=A0A839QFB2_9MICC|nr:DUF3662 and FHA domain-containing protein [Paeniglutamicibacter cryotolerans]MBB2994968.1 hypothetical protein [Paeniglutamicibacter cryotolerans]